VLANRSPTPTNEGDGSSSLFTATESGVGIVAFAFPGSEVMEASPSPVSESPDVALPDGQNTGLVSDSVASEGITAEDKEKQRIHLEGIVGRKPTYYETRRMTPVARFSVGEKTDAGQTHWHAVVAFKKWAVYVRDSVNKRDKVELSGYPRINVTKRILFDTRWRRPEFP
jgi:Single-strand binding protein family